MFFRLRILLARMGHQPFIRGLLEAPDRFDDAVLALLRRAAGRGRTLVAPVNRAVREGIVRAVEAARPVVAWVTAAGSRFVARPLRAVPLTCWMALLATAMTALPARFNLHVVPAVCGMMDGLEPRQLADLPPDSVTFLLTMIRGLSWALLVLLPTTALLLFVRRRFSHFLLKAGVAGFVLLVLLVFRAVTAIPSLLNDAKPEIYENFVRNEMWVSGGWALLPWFVLAAVAVVAASLRPVTRFYGGRADGEGWADRLVADLKSHGEDPGYRKALYTSVGLHLFFIFILPMLAWWGCSEEPYGIPEGSGTPQIEMVKIKKQVKPEKKYVLNMNTDILFHVPKIDESEVFEELDKETENVYEAQQLGKLGAGGGKKGGWPNGMKNARVRFIRLEYEGGDWDQDMGVGADYNMLLKFREYTGFDIADNTESRPITQLKHFPKGRAPPFVYMTGGLRGNINLSNNEIKILREYCLEMGGMIFADNGGGNFDRNFRNLMRRVFPDLPLVAISKDDVLFRYPFPFPNGAPPLWHHSGNDAMGVKHKGRWVVFYHQGDVNDAWKTGHSGASEGTASQAYKLGVNIINYAFTQYMAINHGGTVPK